MWAVIGVYAGEEVNRLYQRSPRGLEEHRARVVSRRQVLTLDDQAIHSVENPRRERTAGLHVYGGDIVGIARSAWGPDGVEVPFAENVVSWRAMFEAMRNVAAARGREISDDDCYDALTAIRAACERHGRLLSSQEASDIVAAAWRVAP